MMLFLYAGFLLLFSVYSYSLIDLNLTLFNNRYWEMFRSQMVALGYFHRDISAAFYLSAVILFFLFNWYFVRHYKRINLILLTAVTGSILLFSYPFLSHDLFNYIFDAKILTFYHKLPYFFTAQNFPHDPWLRFLHWTDRTYPYGPTFLWLTAVPSLLAMNKFILNFFLFKLMWIVFYIAGVWTMGKMNKKWAVVFATHPLIIIEGLVNTHNDLIMVSLAVIGLYFLLEKKRKIRARVFLLISAGIKYLTWPLVFISRKNRNFNRLLFLGFLSVMLFLSLDREIQPWYFLSIFAFLPFFAEEISQFNFFLSGLLLSNYFFVRYGVLNEPVQLSLKTSLIFIFFVLNIGYLFFKYYVRRPPSLPAKRFLMVLLLVAAAASRFLKLNWTAFFGNDQGRDMTVLYQMLVDHKLTLIGPATSLAAKFGNFYFGPYYYYFLFPFFAVNQSPLFMTSIAPALFIAGLVLTLKIKELGFWEKVFFWLLIISSWFSLFHTRFLWNLSIAFILSFVLFDLFLIFREKIISSLSRSLLFGFAAGAVFQMHYGMLFLYVSLIVFFGKRYKNTLLYLVGFVLSFFPFVLFDMRHGQVLSRNLLDFIQSSRFVQSAPSATILTVFEKMFDYYLFSPVNIPGAIKAIVFLLIYLAAAVVLIRKKTVFTRFLLLTYLIFPVTFFFFKRDFDYYLACFFIWFYLGIAILLNSLFSGKGIRKYGVLIFLLIFSVINFIKYFSSIPNYFSVEIQKTMAGKISEYHEKWYADEAAKGGGINKSDKVQVTVYPNQDDGSGVEYILKTQYGLTVSSQGRLQYIICYPGYCPKNRRDLIFLDNNWHTVNLYVFK